MQSQVRFNRVPEKVAEKIPEKVLGIFGAGPGQVQGVPEKVAEKVPEKVAEKIFIEIKRCGCWGYHRSFFFKFPPVAWKHVVLPPSLNDFPQISMVSCAGTRQK